jgi:hypothetical protein
MTVDNVRRNLILGVPAVAIGAQAVAHRAFAQQNASRVNGVTPHEAFRDVKERFVNEAIGITREALDQASVLEALEWQGEFPQSALFRALELPILPAHLDDTTYDYSDLRRRYPVQLGVTSVAADSHRHVVSPRVIPAIDKDRDASFRRDGYLSDGYGNCFYWNSPDTIVTTEHLAERFPESWHSLRRDGFDVSVASVAPHFAARSPEQVIRDDPSVSDADIHGSLVCIVGRDPDPWGDMDGAKVYPGVAVKMTPQFIRGALAEIPQTNRRGMSSHEYEHFIQKIQDRMDNSYLMMLPPGEARGYPRADSELPCQGMSAAPVFGFIRGQYRFVGMFFSAMCLEDAERRRNVDVAFFHPISAIRRLAANQKSYWTLK